MDDMKKPRVRFPLALKLSLVVSAILVFSLGIIIFSVWFLIRTGAAGTAASDNDSINFRVAAAAESVLKEIRGETILLLGSAHAENANRGRIQERLAAHYFERKADIAAVVSVSPDGRAETLINQNFVRSRGISDSLIIEYLNMRGSRLLRDGVETLLVNASPDFYGLPILAARFPYTVGNNLNLAPSVAIVFFSSEVLADYFGYGASQSFLISNSGDVLIQSGDTDAGNLFSNPALSRLYSDGVNHVMTSYHGDASNGVLFASVRRIDFDAALLTVVPGTVVFEGINATTRRNLYLALSVWFISILFFGLFSSRLTRQLRVLEEAAEAIEDGLYRRFIPGKAHDETGFLTERMNALRTALFNFERFTNKQTARLTRKGILAPGGVTKKAVFLFSDIRSFTAISERMDPADVVSFLNDYMQCMVACVMVTGGVIDKFIGDAILAHWGAVTDEPAAGISAESSPDGHAACFRAALRSALLMRTALYCFNQGQEGKKRPYIKIGCGISGGKVAAGLIGTDERLVYTVIGEAVDLAEKAESNNKPYGTEILLAVPGNRIVEEDFITEELPGFNRGPMKLLALINVRSKNETKRLMSELEQLPNINMSVARHCAGADGPKTLKELRVLLGISEVDLSKVLPNEREKKFKVQKP